MAKRRQRGGETTNMDKDITSNIPALFSGATTGVLSVIIIILFYLNYELPVRILTGIYGLFLLIFSVGVIMVDTNIQTPFKTDDDDHTSIKTFIHSSISIDRVPFGILALLSIGMIWLAAIYKHHTIFFAVTVILIFSVVMIRFMRVPLNESSPTFTIPNILLAVCAFAFYLITLFNQLYINTDGGSGITYK